MGSFLFNCTLSPFETSLKLLFNNVGGIQTSFKNILVKRFEMYQTLLNSKTLLPFRGRGHSLGKPIRGQRTWSNAWTAYSSNRILKTYISETQYLKTKDVREEKIDYKKLKRKFKKKVKKVNTIDLTAKKKKKKKKKKS